jgi:hypothetical protein
LVALNTVTTEAPHRAISAGVCERAGDASKRTGNPTMVFSAGKEKKENVVALMTVLRTASLWRMWRER